MVNRIARATGAISPAFLFSVISPKPSFMRTVRERFGACRCEFYRRGQGWRARESSIRRSSRLSSDSTVASAAIHGNRTMGAPRPGVAGVLHQGLAPDSAMFHPAVLFESGKLKLISASQVMAGQDSAIGPGL
jgi:hypothetical protein